MVNSDSGLLQCLPVTMETMFSRAIVRAPGANYAQGLTSVDLGVPNYARALQQHESYCEALEACGLTLTRLEKDERYPDATFVEDTAVLAQATANGSTRLENRALPDRPAPSGLPARGPRSRATAPNTKLTGPGAILTRPGAASRAGEVESIAEVLAQFYSELNSIQAPGTVDGGDVCEADGHFFIGISERTNEHGAAHLARLLALSGYTSSSVDIRGAQEILHLKSGVAYLGDRRLAVIEALAGREEFHGYELVRVNPGEEYAANCVRVNDRILVAAGYPEFEKTLRALGYQTIALEMTEFQKMDGGLSCLSLRF